VDACRRTPATPAPRTPNPLLRNGFTKPVGAPRRSGTIRAVNLGDGGAQAWARSTSIASRWVARIRAHETATRRSSAC